MIGQETLIQATLNTNSALIPHPQRIEVGISAARMVTNKLRSRLYVEEFSWIPFRRGMSTYQFSVYVAWDNSKFIPHPNLDEWTREDDLKRQILCMFNVDTARNLVTLSEPFADVDLDNANAIKYLFANPDIWVVA